MTPRVLGPAQMDALREVGNIGAGTAATALSQMTGAPVRMAVPTVEMLAVEEVARAVGAGDDVVAAMFLGVNGDAPGHMVFVMHESAAREVVDMLLGAGGGRDGFSEMELSALQEVGNILTGAYLTALAQITGLRLEPTPPAVGVDLSGALMGAVLAEVATISDTVLLIQAAFGGDDAPPAGGLLYIPTAAGLTVVLDRLGLGSVITATPARVTGPNVGIGEIAASAEAGITISALGLGSCIGVVLVDRSARVAGMAHVMLPRSREGATGAPGTFADSAIPALVEAVEHLGADPARLVATIAGGAQMFRAGSGGGVFTIGERNDAAVRAALDASGLVLRAADVRGSQGRTMQVRVDTGTVTVRVVGGSPVEL